MSTATKPAKTPKPAKAAKAPAPAPTTAAETGVVSIHGVALSFGDTKGGGTAKSSLAAMIPLKSIQIVKGFNPRQHLKDIDELAALIKKDGLLSSLTVRPADKDGMFDLVCGERRFRALQQLGAEDVSVLIRTDLAGDFERARAIAVAENSDDARFNLNPIELGRVFADLQTKGWTVQRIAGECGLHQQKVRRCLTLMEAPKDVIAQVENNKLSAMSAIEVAKLDDKTREKIKELLTENMSVTDVRALAKSVAKDTEAESAEKPDGKSANKKKGTSRDAALTTWKGSKAKQATMAELAHTLHNAGKEDVGSADYHEIRGALAALLWDRGDIDSPILAGLASTVPADMKANKKFAHIIEAEAGKHTPPEAEAEAASED